MLKLKKISGQLLMALCLIFISNTPAFSQSNCSDADDCNNGCGGDCSSPSYGANDCYIGVACCYNPNDPDKGSYWSNGCTGSAYEVSNCGGCTCCYNPNDGQTKCETWY